MSGIPLLVARRDTTSVAFLAVPEDTRQILLTRHAGDWTIEFDLLGEHLEKGVIRRARVEAWVLPATDLERSLEWSYQLYQQLLAAAPPLTA